MTKIAEIVEQTNGSNAKGPWTRTRIKTDDGKFATTFDEGVKVGDEVTLQYNEQYKNYNAKVVPLPAGHTQNADIQRMMYAKLNAIHRDIKLLLGPPEEPQAAPAPTGNAPLRRGLAKTGHEPLTTEEPLPEPPADWSIEDGEPINLDDIPF